MRVPFYTSNTSPDGSKCELKGSFSNSGGVTWPNKKTVPPLSLCLSPRSRKRVSTPKCTQEAHALKPHPNPGCHLMENMTGPSRCSWRAGLARVRWVGVGDDTFRIQALLVLSSLLSRRLFSTGTLMAIKCVCSESSPPSPSRENARFSQTLQMGLGVPCSLGIEGPGDLLPSRGWMGHAGRGLNTIPVPISFPCVPMVRNL